MLRVRLRGPVMERRMKHHHDPLGRIGNGCRTLAAALALLCLPAVPSALAAVTGTGGGPETTVTAPHTSTTGQTLPPGAAGAPIVDPNERTERQKKLDRVLNGICKGC